MRAASSWAELSYNNAMEINMHTVQSSNIAKVGFDNRILYIEFHTGAIYSYEGVDEFTFAELLHAESIGSYFAKKIKNNYPFDRLA